MELVITEKNATICLNMIVKNESHIIAHTLEKLCNKIKFDYWVICDTGSSDNTPQIIQDFFKKKEINGEIFYDEWVNFAHNRTLALQRAYRKTQLLFIFDADDEIVGNITMPREVLFDQYLFKFGSAYGTSYTRVLLINNYKNFEYLSVIHEFISCKESPCISTTIDGDYYVVSGRTGSRNLDPDKYLKDALILEKAYTEAKEKNNHLFHRYSYYCANSYKDCGRFEDAIKWYKITLSHPNQWNQEKYTACLYSYDCCKALNQEDKGFFYLVKSFQYDTQRVECLYILLVHYCCENMHSVAYNYYLNVKNFFENHYLNTDMTGKLFTIIDRYNFFVPYYMILIADKVQDFKCVIRMYEIIFTKKQKIVEEWYIKNLFYNLQFFLQHVSDDKKDKFINLANEYIDFLHINGINFQSFDFLNKDVYINAGLNFNKYIIKTLSHKNQKFSKEDCANSKNILFYTGFSDIEWNYTYMLNNALGGSEKAIVYLTKCFPKDYNIFITGHVANETIENIHYIHLNELSISINIMPFHTVIVSRYIAFYEMFPNCSFYQSFIWAHDVSLLPYGCQLTEHQIIQKWNNYINGCICLTKWHKDLFMSKYPELKDKITLINNGLDLDNFYKIDNDIKKNKNKFIYSSRPERGLDTLLNLWPQILKKIPDATLSIATYGNFPSNPQENLLKSIIDNHHSICYLGKLNSTQLYEEMRSSEYWLYPTNWPETSCITALEMLMSEVICLYYPVAGLTNTIDKYGIQIKPGSEIEAIVSLTEEDKNKFRENGKKYAESCSWSKRTELWKETLFNPTHFNSISYIYKNNFIKIINLERRKDRLDTMMHKLKHLNIENYEIIKAVDGKMLTPNTYIEKLFKGNDFNYRKGVIGCALSHYKLWNNLLLDVTNNYYCIFEDDVTFVVNFKEKLDKILNIFDGDFCLLGGGSINVPNTDISNLKIVERKDKIVDCAFGYIVTKNGAKKMIEYIKTNHIKRAIDAIYSECFESISVVNEYLVTSSSFQLNGNLETDIQLDYDSLFFTNPIKISYTDWWLTEYCGGNFDYENNCLTDLLSEYYNVQVVKPEDNPDILFYSVFGDNHKCVTANRKIFYSGESISQRDDADFNITFDNNSNKNCRFPLWLCYLNKNLIEDNKKKLLSIFNVPKKTKFCSIICQIDNKTGERGLIIEKLSKYKKVDCGGKFMNNIGYIVPRGINCSGKIEHNNAYKFCIAFENTVYPGYVTEKICDAYKSRCIPIYWGTKDVTKDFNPKTFINANDFTNFDELIEYIIKVDTDEQLYESYFKEPIFSEYWLNIINDPNKEFYKNLANNIVENTNQDIQYFSQNKQDEFLEKYIFNQITNFDCWNLQINHNLEKELKNASQIYNKIIGFHSNQLCERGTEVALFDYAYYNQKIYGNKSIIFYPKNSHNNNIEVIKKFETQFTCYDYENFSDVENIIKLENIDYFYIIKYGNNDNLLVKSCPNLVHAVFTVEPHGEKYATVSKYLSDKYHSNQDYVPHMINLPIHNDNMRNELKIPNDAIVLGRYGGFEQFDIKIAHKAIIQFIEQNTNIYFIFANTKNFYKHSQIIYIDKIIDPIEKVKFINTCDAMIHARSDGETFGLAVAEFSTCNKPVITCKSNHDNCHIDILGDKAIIYDSIGSLLSIFTNIREIIKTRDDWNAYKEYTPEIVMKQFNEVFLK